MNSLSKKQENEFLQGGPCWLSVVEPALIRSRPTLSPPSRLPKGRLPEATEAAIAVRLAVCLQGSPQTTTLLNLPREGRQTDGRNLDRGGLRHAKPQELQ